MHNNKITVFAANDNIFKILSNKKRIFKNFFFYFSNLTQKEGLMFETKNINLIFIPNNYNSYQCKQVLSKLKNINYNNFLLCVDKNLRSFFNDVKKNIIFLPLSFSELKNELNKLILSIPIVFKDLKLNKQNNSLLNIKNNAHISLTLIEANILDVLINSTKPIKKLEINKLALGYSENVNSHSLDSHIYRLRKKILKISSIVKIKSSSNLSYKIT